MSAYRRQGGLFNKQLENKFVYFVHSYYVPVNEYTAADKLAAEIERVNADNRALRRKVERLERELQKARAGA